VGQGPGVVCFPTRFVSQVIGWNVGRRNGVRLLVYLVWRGRDARGELISLIGLGRRPYFGSIHLLVL
jgi:hypothetical protein